METIDQLSTSIYVYVDNYQNNIYVQEIMMLLLLRIDFFRIYSKKIILQISEYIQQYSVILTRCRSGAETKSNACNNK